MLFSAHPNIHYRTIIKSCGTLMGLQLFVYNRNVMEFLIVRM